MRPQNKKIRGLPKNIIEGGALYLRELRVSDVNRNYRNWMRDPEVTQYLESRFENWTIKGLKDYVRKIRRDPDFIFLAIVLRDKNKHIGNIKIGPINRIHNYGDVGIIIGDRSCWRKGFATEAIKLAVDYSFSRLNLRKLTAGAYGGNIGSIKAFKKAGFSIEGRRKRHYSYGGKHVDSILMGIIRK
jgi:RimJ/RimL family protein N-acetyltransferase